jgi:hypothetical protein
MERFDYLCCETCTPDDIIAVPRQVLETAIGLLPTRSSRELRELVSRLDSSLFSRAHRDPTVITDGPWWNH